MTLRAVPKPAPREESEEYRAFIRSKPCLLYTRGQCYGRTEAAHVKSRGAGGSDVGNLVNLCTRHHAKQHNLGVVSFEKRYGISLKQLAADLEAEYLK